MEKEFKTIDEQINILKSRNIVENEIDTYVAYEFSKSYGHKNYLNLKNFNSSNYKESIIQKFIDDVNLEIQYQYKNSNEMITHLIYHKKLKIQNINGNYQHATRDLFSIVIILKVLLEKEQFNKFYRDIVKSIDNLEKQLSIIEIDKVLYKMGFPRNYKKLLNL